MSLDARALKIMQDRRELLSALNLVYPGGFTLESLIHALLHIDPDPENVRRDLAYLVAKDYVLCTNPKSWPESKRYYRLTPEGNERANRIIHDPAIDP